MKNIIVEWTKDGVKKAVGFIGAMTVDVAVDRLAVTGIHIYLYIVKRTRIFKSKPEFNGDKGRKESTIQYSQTHYPLFIFAHYCF